MMAFYFGPAIADLKKEGYFIFLYKLHITYTAHIITLLERSLKVALQKET